jgi:hypothetical protein
VANRHRDGPDDLWPDSPGARDSASTISESIERVIATSRLLGLVTCNVPVFFIAPVTLFACLLFQS